MFHLLFYFIPTNTKSYISSSLLFTGRNYPAWTFLFPHTLKKVIDVSGTLYILIHLCNFCYFSFISIQSHTGEVIAIALDSVTFPTRSFCFPSSRCCHWPWFLKYLFKQVKHSYVTTLDAALFTTLKQERDHIRIRHLFL